MRFHLLLKYEYVQCPDQFGQTNLDRPKILKSRYILEDITLAGKHDQIAGALIQDILSGRYRVSERLPSERDLSTRFDANRGAVREAMTKLEQIGLAEVRPGGARVKGNEDASIEVIGHMLAQDKLPDANLIDQIMVVINSLVSVAAEQSLNLATEDEIAQIRKILDGLINEKLSIDEHVLARFELLQVVVSASGNLPLRIIIRTLLEQVGPNITALNPYAIVNDEAYKVFARQLDKAFEQHDQVAMCSALASFSELNRETMLRALESARANLGPEATIR